MIYKNMKRAKEVAAMLNQRRGYPWATACRVEQGWTVIGSYSNLSLGMYGILEIAK